MPSLLLASDSSASVEKGTASRELRPETRGQVRHLLVPCGPARGPLPHLAGAVRRLLALGERLFEEREIHGLDKVAPERVLATPRNTC